MFLRCDVQATPKQWTKCLSLAELWYNTSYHEALKCSPFKTLYGVDPSPGLLPSLRTVDHPDVISVLKERQVFIEFIKDQLARAKNKMKAYADSNRTELSFQVGEQVLLKLQPYAQSLVVNRHFPKLAFKYFGPYQVLEKLGPVVYKLQLPDNSSVHLVFHVSQLKFFTVDYSLVHSQLPDTPALDVLNVIPERILDWRLVKKGNVAITQVLVQWSGLPDSSSTWED
jgi:hypothetical protein